MRPLEIIRRANEREKTPRDPSRPPTPLEFMRERRLEEERWKEREKRDRFRRLFMKDIYP